MNSIDQIKLELKQFIASNFQVDSAKLERMDFKLNIDDAKQQFGDISTNVAMTISKDLGRNPREIAQEIVDGFNSSFIEKFEIAGPGFINIFCKAEFFHQLITELNADTESFFKPKLENPQHYSIEFVSANPTGPLHFGHGRGGIIGDTLSKVLTFLGYPVTKEYYINDAGNQMNNLGLSLLARVQEQLGKEFEIPENGYKGDYLVDAAKQCIAEYGKEVIDKPDHFFAKYAEEKMLKMIDSTLADYGITFDVWFSERKLHTSGAIDKAIKQLTDDGYTYEKDDALWFKSTEFGDDKDRVVRKSDGNLTYAAADIAYMLSKVKRGADHMVLALGQDHHSYATRLEGLRQALGLNKTDLSVILYQLVSISASGEAVRMSKRAGKFVTLRDIIDEVGKDVARFFFLHRKADSQLDFDVDLALKKTEENPVFYIQYALVRIKGISRKANEINELQNITIDDAKNLGSAEHQILKKIAYLKELLITISTTQQTHQLSYYAIELARLFHSYYSKNKVIDLENINQSRTRLLMLKQIENTLKLVLDLLGLSKPEKM